MKEKKIKKVFTEGLPKKGKTNKTDWLKSNMHEVNFIYNNIEGQLKIVDVKREKNKTILGIKYLDNEVYYMSVGHFMNARLGEILGTNTKRHYYNVGDIIETNTGKIKIKKQIRKRKNNKWYIYECLECGWDNGQADEYNLKKKQGCGCCSNKVSVLGINTVWDTDSWMIPYFINSEDAKTHTFGSNDKGLLHCPVCKTPKPNMSIVTLHRDKDIHCEVCYDGFSYGEKYTYNLLKQLNIKVKRHKYFEWSKNVYSEISSLCGNKEYDFYIKIDDEDYILETNGLQHYEECGFSRRSCFEESQNDILKETLAMKNHIKEENYIIIDCRYSNAEYIKNSILNNEKLKNKFDLSKIDWSKCEKHANTPYFIEALKYYNLGIGYIEIADIMEIDFKTVKRYLKRAREHGLCDFKTTPEIKIENKLKAIELWSDGIHNTSEIAKQLNLDSTVICDYLNEAEAEGLIIYKQYIKDCIRKEITKSCDTEQAYKGFNFQYTSENNIHI